MRRVRVVLRTAALLVALLLAAALPTASEASTLQIGGLVSETGSASPYGLSELKGLRLAVRMLNSQHVRRLPRLQLRTIDDKSDPATAEAGARRLIAGGSNVLLAPTLSPVAAAVGPIAQQARIGFIGVTTTTLDLKSIGPVAYRIALTEDRLVPATLSLLRRRGVRTAALVFDSTDGYSAGAAEAFRKAARALRITLKTSVDLAGHGTQSDLDTALRQANATHPKAILLALRSTEASESLIAARRAGTHAALAGGNGFNVSSVINAAGSAANGLITAAPWNPMISAAPTRAFVAAYRRAYGGHYPDAQAALGFATIELLRSAASIGGTSRAGVLRGLQRLPADTTVLGRVRFVAHEARYSPVVQQVQHGRFVLIVS